MTALNSKNNFLVFKKIILSLLRKLFYQFLFIIFVGFIYQLFDPQVRKTIGYAIVFSSIPIIWCNKVPIKLRIILLIIGILLAAALAGFIIFFGNIIFQNGSISIEQLMFTQCFPAIVSGFLVSLGLLLAYKRYQYVKSSKI